MRNFYIFVLCTILFLSCKEVREEIEEIPENISPPPSSEVVPTPSQVSYQQMEMIGFIHFTVNTFTDKEWGMGDEKPEVFNPTELDVEQWARVAKEAGMKELILTAKHHDGFCLWPSAYTEHSIKNSPYQNGQGDIVKEFTDACIKYGLKVGLYLSPWDRNHPDYGKPEYIEYYRNQLTELLTNYGEINEIWFDGANGGTGYYGGANEERRIDKLTYYDWPNTIALAKKLQPNILIFSDAGPDIRWVGNEDGFAGEPFWSTIRKDNLVIGGADARYLNTGEPNGDAWIVGQCDVSIRPGWFYHQVEDDSVKSTPELMDIYYKSVGRNGILLLNLPPDRRGLIHKHDVDSLMRFKENRESIFSNELISKGAKAMADSYWGGHPNYAAPQLLDNSFDTYWAAAEGKKKGVIDIIMDEPQDITHLVLQEYIPLGQRISEFTVSMRHGYNWQQVAKGRTIGLKRIVQFDTVNANAIKVEVITQGEIPTLASIRAF